MATPSEFLRQTSPSPPSRSLTLSPPLVPLQDEQILYAAKQDSEELLSAVFTSMPSSDYDVNFQDGLGNTGEFVFQWRLHG